MADETKIKTASLPADYVSIAVLRERWVQRQNAKKQEEAKKEMMEFEEGCVDGKKYDCVKGKGKKKVVEEVRSGGVEKRGRNVELCQGNLDRYVDGMKMNGGGGLRGFRDGGDWRRERIEVEGFGNRRMNDLVDIGGKFQDLEISGGGDKYGRKGENGDVKRYVVDVRAGNVVDVKLLDDLGVNEELEIGGKFMDLLRNGRRDGGKFGKVLGVGKGENLVEKKRNVVDVREENVVDGKMLEISKGNGDRIINEAVDIGRKFGDFKVNGGGKRGKFRYGRERPRFLRPLKDKIPVAVRKEDQVEKPIAVSVRRENEAEKKNFVYVKENIDVEKQIPAAVRDGNEVKNRNLVDVKMAESSKRFGHRRGNDAVRRESGVEKQNLVDVKEKNDVEKQIPVAVRGGNEVKKRNLVDVKMAESSKGFGHWRGNEAIRGKFGGLSNNGWRKGNGKYGRGRGRFGSWKNKQEESGMMWVKKADTQA